MSKVARNPEVTACFDELAQRLRQIVQGRPILFFINPGNWGDSLIREGSEQFFRHYGFEYKAIRFGDVLKKRIDLDKEIATIGTNPVMIYCGNGAFSGHYGLPGKIAVLTHKFDTAVILPSTCAMDIGKLGFSANTTFFIRDKSESAKWLPDADFCHDMAFFLEADPSETGKGEAWFLRDDAERPKGAPLHRKNVDLSRYGRAYSPIGPLFKRIAQFRTIHTNRLHIGISAAMLGKDVRLYSNDYFKIRAIYQASLQPYYPNVQFTQDLVIAPRDIRRWYHRFW